MSGKRSKGEVSGGEGMLSGRCESIDPVEIEPIFTISMVELEITEEFY